MIAKRDRLLLHDDVALLLHDMTLAYHRYTVFASRQRGSGTTELVALGYLRDEGPLTAGELGTRLGLTAGSVTTLLDRLERLGYAHRQPHPSDRRALLVELTPSGRREVGNLFELLASDVNTALDSMSQMEQGAVVRFLGAMTSCFEQRTTVPPDARPANAVQSHAPLDVERKMKGNDDDESVS